MKTRELFLKDPLSWTLVNEGVSSNNSSDLDTLRYELQTFVCSGEYRSGLSRILQSYLDGLGKEQKAAWVSGFYGSGKSHLVKVLRFLWTDHKFSDGMTARNLASPPKDVGDLLKELSTRGKQGAGLHSAGGTLKAGMGSVRLRLLGILFQSVGLPENLSVARLLMDLRDEGQREAVENAIISAGKKPAEEFERLYTSKVLHEAYLKAFPHHGDLKSVGNALRASYPANVAEVTIADLVKFIRRALAPAGKLPCTVVVLDEVQQFINGNADTALEVQEIVEACSKTLDGQLMFVGTGQSALTDTPALQRLMGRFPLKIHLRDNDVEEVVRTVVLQKKEPRKKDIQDLVTKQSGEISQQLKATKLASRPDDDKSYVPDYPLLPVRRRFWERVMHSVDPSGTTAQMRTQLRVTHEACRSAADRELGAVIPADFIYDQLSNDLVMAGEMQKRFQEMVEEQKSKPEGALRSRICALVFLINKLPRDGADTGVRANDEHLADLLTDDLDPSATALREKLPVLAQQLVTDGVLMEVDGEYRLQTTEGAAWESEYRSRRGALLSNEPQIAAQRGQLLSKAIQDEIGGLSVLHGAAKEKRKASLHYGAEPPETSDGPTVWVRDGFRESETAVIQEIQARNVDDPVVHVLIPKAKADELKKALVGALAAEETLNVRGNPSTPEGREARASMISRQASEGAKVDEAVKSVVGGARVFLSGGQELPVIAVREAVEGAAGQVLDRLYPKFQIADSPNWPTVLRKAKEGNAGALSAVAYQGDPDRHPVSAAVIQAIGAGKKGADLIEQFTASPYGWPKDAIDATIAVLMVSGHLGARLQGNPVKLGDLDQKKISQADYRIEHPVLTAPQKLKIRKLFQDADHKFQPGDEGGAAPGFVEVLRNLARRAGGDPPAPEAPRPPVIAELEGLTGNTLLFKLFEKADELSKQILTWKVLEKKVAERMPRFQLARQIVAYADGRPGLEEQIAHLDAVRSNRSLLDDPEPIRPVLEAVASDLRGAIKKAHDRYSEVSSAERSKLSAQPIWAALQPSKQEALLQAASVLPRPVPKTATDEDLLATLQTCDLAGWRTETDALPTRFAEALAAAIREAEPKARRIALPSATVKTSDEVESWITKTREELLKAIASGPVIL